MALLITKFPLELLHAGFGTLPRPSRVLMSTFLDRAPFECLTSSIASAIPLLVPSPIASICSVEWVPYMALPSAWAAIKLICFFIGNTGWVSCFMFRDADSTSSTSLSIRRFYSSFRFTAACTNWFVCSSVYKYADIFLASWIASIWGRCSSINWFLASLVRRHSSRLNSLFMFSLCSNLAVISGTFIE